MSKREYLRCGRCPEPFEFVAQTEMWLYACGHLRCPQHLDDRCCENQSRLCNLLLDPVIQKTSEYLVFLQSCNCDEVYYLRATAESLIDLLVTRIEHLFQIYTQKCESDCIDVQKPPEETGDVQSERTESVTEVIKAHPIVDSSKLFYSFETLTMSSSLRRLPWDCPKCHQTSPGANAHCPCGYVNLKQVDIDLPLDSPERLPEVPESLPPELHQQYWKCSNCTYEYNLIDTRACVRCSHLHTEESKQPTESVCSRCRQPSKSIEQSLCASCRLAARQEQWVCPRCKSVNLKVTQKCSRCGVKQSNVWTCLLCGKDSYDDKRCTVCTKERHWRCTSCLAVCPIGKKKCVKCGKKRL